jgi:STE24 endopeptidase
MPVPLLLAMILAFGLRLPTESSGLPAGEVMRRVAWTALGVACVALTGVLFGLWISNRVKRLGRADSVARRRFTLAVRVVVGLGLAVFTATLGLLDWTRAVDWGFGLRGVPVVEEAFVLAPYLLGQVLASIGLYRAERTLRAGAGTGGLVGDLLRKGRRSGGLILPVAVMYIFGRDFLREGSTEDPTIAFASLCGVAVLVFLLSPAFVRLAFPLRPLPSGELRDRLERLSRRLRFRCTDILVWDTGKAVINAGVTGAIPQFRYVLLTDALIERLDYGEIEAVFGHEVGHVAHRHLPYFAFFFLGSAAFLTLAASAVERFADVDQWFERLTSQPAVGEVVKAGLVLVLLGAYFFLVFGALSRRFERQADLYGTRAVSCGLPDCPPHFDPNVPEAPTVPVRSVCAGGVRLFGEALEDVALLNGMAIEKNSWRHGTIASRIAFLDGLVSQPGAERRFERATTRLRWGLIVFLAIACATAWGVSWFGPVAP